ncbi:MAG TPA: GNAT family protein [Candidatus Wallbacteria bacterium]|nr:GNAT family protein [Candidatus Wallbacteria bacterium]
MKNEKYDRVLTGRKCYLSPLCADDAPLYKSWINDMEVGINLGATPQILTFEKEKEILDRIMKSRDSYTFAIIEKKNDKLIGSISLMNVDFINRHAMFGIVIGEKTFWNGGFGTEATGLMLDYGFNILNLNSIYLNVFSYNKRGIRCYEKCGFKIAGVLRESRLFADKYYDTVMMDILKDEYKGGRIRLMLSK